MLDQFYDLSNLGLLRISGLDAEKLLQGQLSCDMTTISAENGAMGAHCNPQGRIISLFYATRIQDAFYLILPQSMLPIAMTALKKYAVFFKTTLDDATGSLVLAGGTTNANPEGTVAIIHLPQQRSLFLLNTPLSSQSNIAGFAAWKYLDIQQGIPAIYPETSGKFLPHDLNLQQLNAVNFAKGCYTGQEIIARMHYRGKPKRHLYQGKTKVALPPGTLLYLEKESSHDVGTVIDSGTDATQQQTLILLTTDETTALQPDLITTDGHSIALNQAELYKSELS
jgi:folate-binding protein YgfZ